MNLKDRVKLNYIHMKYFTLLKYYKKFQNVFNEAVKNILSLHCKDLNHAINLKLNITSFFKSLYNLLKKKLMILKEYINKNLINDFIIRFKFFVKTLILFIKKFNDLLI